MPLIYWITAACNAGSYLTTSGCTQCAANSFSASGAYICTSCPSGYTSNAGSTSISDCQGGNLFVFVWMYECVCVCVCVSKEITLPTEGLYYYIILLQHCLLDSPWLYLYTVLK